MNSKLLDLCRLLMDSSRVADEIKITHVAGTVIVSQGAQTLFFDSDADWQRAVETLFAAVHNYTLRGPQ